MSERQIELLYFVPIDHLVFCLTSDKGLVFGLQMLTCLLKEALVITQIDL